MLMCELSGGQLGRWSLWSLRGVVRVGGGGPGQILGRVGFGDDRSGVKGE